LEVLYIHYRFVADSIKSKSKLPWDPS